MMDSRVEAWRLQNRLTNSRKRIAEQDPECRMTLDSLKEPHGLQNPLAHARWMLSEKEKSFEEQLGMLLIGEPALGKTHLMIGLARELVNQGHPIWWSNAREFVSDIQRSYGDVDAIPRDEVIRRALTHQVLFIDDLGKERATEDVDTIMYDLIDGLEIKRRATPRPLLIASSNLSPDEYQRQYDSATRSRLEGMCLVFKIEGEDYRVKRPKRIK